MRTKLDIIGKRIRKINKTYRDFHYSKAQIEKFKKAQWQIHKLLNFAFDEDREEFINSINNKLQQERIRYMLRSHYDSTINTYQSQIERYLINGWKYKDGRLVTLDETCSTIGCTCKDSLKYAEFLTKKYLTA